jgi:hypothetical protein
MTKEYKCPACNNTGVIKQVANEFYMSQGVRFMTVPCSCTALGPMTPLPDWRTEMTAKLRFDELKAKAHHWTADIETLRAYITELEDRLGTVDN